MHRLLTNITLLAALVSPIATSNPPPRMLLDLRVRPQYTANWCWAATTEMIVEFLDPSLDVEQCSMADRRTGRSDCCGATTPSECVSTGWPRFRELGFDAQRTKRKALSWEAVKREISSKRPIAFSWEWRTGGTGHMMVLTGYETIDGVDLVWIADPSPLGTGSARRIAYTEYVKGDVHTHWDDFYEIEKR